MQSISPLINSDIHSESWIKFRGTHQKSNNITIEKEAKALISLLLSLIQGGSQKEGQQMASLISTLIYDLLTELKRHPDPIAAIDAILAVFDPDHPEHLFSACPQTQDKLLPKGNQKELSKLMIEEYKHDLEELDSFRAKSNKVALALDTTHEAADSIYKNGEFTYAVIGQSEKPIKGFIYETVEDVTHHLFCNSTRNKKNVYSVRELPTPHGIQLLCESIEAARSRCCEVSEIYLDRYYYDTRYFAYAYFRQFDGKYLQQEPIRVIVPKKFPRGKESKKREMLENQDYPEIKLSSMQLNSYSEPHLKNLCQYYGIPKKDGCFHIPMVEVVCVNHSDGDKQMNFDAAKRYYSHLKTEKHNAEQRLHRIEAEYVSHLNHLGYTLKKAPNLLHMKFPKRIHGYRHQCLIRELKLAQKRVEQLGERLESLVNSVNVFCLRVYDSR